MEQSIPTKQKVKERATITGLKKTIKIPDLVSIKANLSKQESDSKNDKLSFGNDEVSIKQLKTTWYGFVEKLKNDGREREYTTLNQNVDFRDDLSIRLTLPNSFQSLTIEGLQQELLTYLRSKLNNGKIQLITEIEKAENKKMIYTNSEKFDFLAEKYPNLEELRSRLDLDTDF